MGPNGRVPARQAGLIALALAVLVAPACGDDSAPKIGATTTVPDACGKRVPLLIDLHGYGEDAESHESVVRWRPFAEEHHFVAITPQAGGNRPRWDLDGDVATVAHLIDDAIATQCVDAARVYVTGYSMGGMLISHLACRLADRIATVAPVAGLRPVEPCEPSRPVPALVLHGTADNTVLFDGGLNPVSAAALDMPVDGPSITSMVDAWAERNGCGADVESAPGVNDRVTIERYACPPGAEVELHVFEGGHHGWPGFANEVIWSFFEQHSRH